MAHILFLNMHIDPSIGGIEKVMSTLCDLFTAHGHHVFCATDPGQNIDEELNYRAVSTDWESLGLFINKHRIDTIINQAAHNDRFARIVTQLRKEFPQLKIISCLHNDPQFLHANLCNSLSIQNFRSFKSAVRTLIRYAFLPIYYYRTLSCIKNTYYQCYENSDYLVLLSDRFTDRFVSISGITSTDKIKAIPNPVDITAEGGGLAVKNKTVLIVSRLVAIKRIDLALKIWLRLNQQHAYANQWILRIVGAGPQARSLERMVKKNGLKNVVFVGFLPDPTPEYLCAPIFMMTSQYEGFGLTLVEAQAHGSVPIAFDSYAALHEIIQNQVNGIIVPNDNVENYVDRLAFLMENSEKRATFERNGRVTSKRFASSLIYELWDKLIEKT